MPAANVPHPPAAEWLQLGAIQCLGICGAFVTVVLPLVVGATVEDYGLRASIGGRVAFVEMGAIAAGSLAAAWLLRFAWRRVGAAAIVAMMLANSLSCLRPDFTLLLALRALSGLGEGALLGLMAAAIGRTRAPEKNFAVFVVLSFLLAALTFRILPALVHQHGVSALFGLISGLSALALAALPRFPAGGSASTATPKNALDAEPAARTAPMTGSQRRVLIEALAAVLLFYTGIGSAWAFMERIGRSMGMSAGDVSGILSWTSVTGLCAALVAMILGVRLGRTLPLVAGLLGVTGSLGLLAVHPTPMTFHVLALLFVVSWNFSFPYLMGTLSAMDTSGRCGAFNISLQYVGFSVGPLLGGMLLSSGSYAPVLILGAFASSTSLGLFGHALQTSRHVTAPEAGLTGAT